MVIGVRITSDNLNGNNELKDTDKVPQITGNELEIVTK